MEYIIKINVSRNFIYARNKMYKCIKKIINNLILSMLPGSLWRVSGLNCCTFEKLYIFWSRLWEVLRTTLSS